MYPDIITKTVEYFKKFSGIGEKTAERLTLSILEMDNEDVEVFSECVKDVRKKIIRCNVCGNITEQEKCSICLNESRNNNLICLVEDFKSVIMFERTGNYNGKYHVLNGLISPIDGITPDDLNIDNLIKRISDIEGDKEIIIAFKPSIEGETTTLYLKKVLEKYNVKITRLSYGIPMGVEIDYLDSVTLDRALKDRKDI